MRQILPASLLFAFLLVFSACDKNESTIVPTPLTPDIDEEALLNESSARLTRVSNFMAQMMTQITQSGTIAAYANVSSCPVVTNPTADQMNLDFGEVDDPCTVGADTQIGGTVDLYRGGTGDLLATCPGPYTKGTLAFDHLFVEGCFVNVQNNGDWDNITFYAKDDCDDNTAQPGDLVEFDFFVSPTWNLHFTDGNRLSHFDPIINTAGPFLSVSTVVPSDDLFDFNVLLEQEYKLHLPSVSNNGNGNYYSELTMFDLPTLQQDVHVGLFTAPNNPLCYAPNVSQYITRGILFAEDLDEPDPSISVTTYDFASDETGFPAGENDAFVRVCYNEKSTDSNGSEIVVEICKVLECLVF